MVPGEYTVEITVIQIVRNQYGEIIGEKVDPKLKFDPKFNSPTILTANVQKGSENTFDFYVSLK